MDIRTFFDRGLTRERRQSAQGPPPPMRTEPQFVPIRPQVELRPAARTRRLPATLLDTNFYDSDEDVPTRHTQPVDWSVPKHSSRLKKLKVLSQDEINTETECNVCFETHKKDKILTTECKHNYCITCWSTWMAALQSNKACPSCRKLCPTVTYYKVKTTTKREQHDRVTA